jgi:hypothetical protein
MLETKFDEMCLPDRQPAQLSMEKAKDCLALTARCFERVLVLVDALDECLAKETLLPILNDLVNSRDSNFKLLVTSRRETDIEVEFIHSPTVQLSAATNSEDILLYVSAEIQRRIEKGTFRTHSSSLKDTIISRLVLRADGM